MTCPNTGWGENPKMIIEQTRLFGTQEQFVFLYVPMRLCTQSNRNSFWLSDDEMFFFFKLRNKQKIAMRHPVVEILLLSIPDLEVSPSQRYLRQQSDRPSGVRKMTILADMTLYWDGSQYLQRNFCYDEIDFFKSEIFLYTGKIS